MHKTSVVQRSSVLHIFVKYVASFALASAALVMLSGCGGSGGGDVIPGGGTKDSWVAGSYKPSSDYANFCASPRVGVSSITGIPFPDKKGTSLQEKQFLRSWSFETYLWFEDLPDINPNNSDTPQTYFNRLVSNERTASGSYKDNFHFYEPTEDEEAWTAGITYGYGLNLKVNWNIPRTITVVYSDTGSPAATKNIKRGAKIIAIDGLSVATMNENTLINALYPSQINAAHEFELQDVGASNTRKVTLESASLATDSVSVAKAIDHNGSKVGYVQFNTFIPDAQDKWVAAINNLSQAGVTDLVVDMRYNGGGYIAVASQVAYMIAGSYTTGKVFYQDVANSKMPREAAWDFINTGLYGTNKYLVLPTLNLPRVYVLATSGTCSASELVINSLRGIGVSVYLIGDTTCGKPYGFIPQPNCGTTYYTIQFKAVNAKGFGEYSDGFIPSATDNGLDKVKGCVVADDLNHELGDPNEKLLAAALQLRATGACPTTASSRMQKTSVELDAGELVQPDVRSIMIR
ncbi:S41 family peptidase [Cellvibrio sp. NN19]|uniref:S41 family peptidase n=1 Tax=Cellvibrio chitinivorans TaxID=3102792 RepID=UPI002B418602|nr:S41 family peptidase [Cellvibrio sp. NN19]